MLEFDWEYIPLSLEINDGIATFIIDNTLLGSSRFGSFSHYPYRAFGLILQLFHNELTRDVFPKELYEVLDTDFNIPHFFFHDLLVGEGDQGKFHHALKLDMNISEEFSLPIQLTNIQYCHGYSFKTLNRTISLSTQQAFYLFANILLNDRCYIYNNHFTAQSLMDISPSDFTQFIHEADKWRVNRYGKSYTVLNQFSFIYFQHLYSELMANRISPAALLCYSGATSLSFLQSLPPVDRYISDVLSSMKGTPPKLLNQRVLYYTLLYSSVDFSKLDDEVFRFIDDGSVYKKNFYDKTVAKEFPASDKLVYEFE